MHSTKKKENEKKSQKKRSWLMWNNGNNGVDHFYAIVNLQFLFIIVSLRYHRDLKQLMSFKIVLKLVSIALILAMQNNHALYFLFCSPCYIEFRCWEKKRISVFLHFLFSFFFLLIFHSKRKRALWNIYQVVRVPHSNQQHFK